MWVKIKKILAWIGGIVIVICGILFASKRKRNITPNEIKEALEKARQQVEEEKKKVEEAQSKIEEARKQTDEEVEHAKDVEVPNDPAAVTGAFNDLLERIRGKSGSDKQQDCDGCSGRH